MATRYDSGTALKGQLLTNGYSFPFDISSIIDYASRHDLGIDYVLGQVYKSPQFKAYFPGIFRSDGTLRMSPAQYLSYKEQAQHAAASAGFSLSNAQIGALVNHEVSADEFAFRIQAASEIRANTDLLSAFNEQLKAYGYKTINTGQAAFNFLTGQADHRVYQVYEAAGLEAAFLGTGLQKNPRNAKDYERLAALTPGVTSFADAQKAAQQFAADRTLAQPELESFGLTLQDQQKVALGIANAQTIQKYAQAINQRKANLQTPVMQTTLAQNAKSRPIVPTTQEPGL